ncbi:MAG: hypothetical protein CFE21_23250, partial [Bacteroidetes bacterium B1(2017)]
KRFLSSKEKFKQIKSINYLITFSIICSLYSIAVLDYEAIDVLRVLRPYLLFFSLSYFYLFTKEDLLYTIKSITIITVFISILYLLQIPTNTILIGSPSGDVNTTILTGTSWIRYYNTPMFLIISFILVVFQVNFINKKVRYLSIVILGLSIIAPAHRSMLILTFGILIVYYISKTNFRNKIILGIALFCAILYLSNVDIFLKTASRTYQNLNVFESSKYKQQDEM